MIEDLYIEDRYLQLIWKDDVVENTLWLQLSLPFTAVKNLFISKEFTPGIAAALQTLVGERTMEVLPSLQNIFVYRIKISGSLQETHDSFRITLSPFLTGEKNGSDPELMPM